MGPRGCSPDWRDGGPRRRAPGRHRQDKDASEGERPPGLSREHGVVARAARRADGTLPRNRRADGGVRPHQRRRIHDPHGSDTLFEGRSGAIWNAGAA